MSVLSVSVVSVWVTWVAVAAPASAAGPEVRILEPSPLEAVFDQVEVVAELSSPQEVARAELSVDGRAAGELREPPWRWTVDVGGENRAHRFEVVAHDTSGRVGRAELTTPRLRIDAEVEIELQQLYVTATRDGERVLDLGAESFRVFDDRRRQQLVTFGRGDLPLTAVLLLDASESMRGERYRAALRGAEAFAGGMRPLDEAMLMLFSDQLLRATPFTGERGELLAPLEEVAVGGNTAINDHLYLALKLLDARQGRRVVVLFSDGADLHSVLGMEEVLWKARRSQALVYWIRLEDRGPESSFTTAWRDAEGNRRELALLERAVEESGGRIAAISTLEEIEPAFREILRELRDQYVLGYYPRDPRDDGSWREVEVEVLRPGVKVRARGGYVDF